MDQKLFRVKHFPDYFAAPGITLILSLLLFRSSHGGVVSTHAVHDDIDLALCAREASEKSSWTNFHFVMCIGILGK